MKRLKRLLAVCTVAGMVVALTALPALANSFSSVSGTCTLVTANFTGFNDDGSNTNGSNGVQVTVTGAATGSGGLTQSQLDAMVVDSPWWDDDYPTSFSITVAIVTGTPGGTASAVSSPARWARPRSSSPG